MLKDAAARRRPFIQRRGDLEIEEDIGSQRRLWAVQKAASFVALAVLAAAAAGLLGRELMPAVLHPLAIYAFLLITFSLAGKRTMAEMDTFDMVTLLIISEATQNALTHQNDSLGYAFLVILTLVGCSFFMAWLKARRPHIEQVIQGGPLIIVENGHLLEDRMKRAYVDEQDILSSARSAQVERIDQIKYAILETSGGISVIPKG